MAVAGVLKNRMSLKSLANHELTGTVSTKRDWRGDDESGGGGGGGGGGGDGGGGGAAAAAAAAEDCVSAVADLTNSACETNNG